MTYRIKITKQFSCSHRGAPNVTYEPGVYSAPDEISDVIAQRALTSGCAALVHEPLHVKTPAPENKLRKRAPENKLAS